MTIEEMAKKWVEIEVINDPLLNDPDWEQVKRCMSYTLACLLEELPEVKTEKPFDMWQRIRFEGMNEQLQKIKSLIQTKLK